MTPIKVESWIWYGFAMSMVFLRLLARYLHFKSVTRLQIEDWLMLWISCLYTIFMVFLNISAVTNSNLINPSDIPNLTPEDVQMRIYGSKIILVVEQCMCAVQWGTKACLLILYWRLTENLVDNILIKGTAIYVAVTYVVMEILYFGVWCRPFHDYWETPTDNVQCTTALHHLILNLVFNLTSDLLIMSIPLPLVLRAHLEFKRKILLILPFTLGFFSIICAILSKHLSFTQPFSSYWVYWYVREASTVMIVSNMPYTWGLVRRIFKLHSFFGSSHGASRNGSTGMERTFSSGMGMVGGEIREVRGVELGPDPVYDPGQTGGEAPTHVSSQTSRKGSFFRLASWKKSSNRGLDRLSSTNPSRNGPADSLSETDDTKVPWNQLGDSRDSTAKADPASSSSTSSATTSEGKPPLAYASINARHSSHRVYSDAVDRLYRLDDGDLMADLDKQQKRSDARDPG